MRIFRCKKEGATPSKCTVGEIYVLNADDPFREHQVLYEVIECREGWIRYQFIYPGGSRGSFETAPEQTFLNVFSLRSKP
jgi:hypothetical protein